MSLIECETCRGEGVIDPSGGMAEYRLCPDCDGDGIVEGEETDER